MVKYFIDEDKRTCVCVIEVKVKKGKSNFTYSFKGKAKCSPEDDFDKSTGSELAHLRALLKFKAWEKERHQAGINFCNKAMQYYSEQSKKLAEKHQKTLNALERLNNEYDELMDEL